jgi:hypothetical protein
LKAHRIGQGIYKNKRREAVVSLPEGEWKLGIFVNQILQQVRQKHKR